MPASVAAHRSSGFYRTGRGFEYPLVLFLLALAVVPRGGDARAATGTEAVVRAAYQGRVEALLLAEGEAVWGCYDEAADEVESGPGFAETGEDLLDAAAVRTLRHGGDVHVLPREEMPDDAPVAAILRH